MWFERKNITSEEAKKENERMFALEDRVDDEFDKARIDDGVKSYLEYEKQKNKKGNKDENL